MIRGEREVMIFRSLCEVLKKTGAADELVIAAMFASLKASFGEQMADAEIIKAVARAMADADPEFNCKFGKFLLIYRSVL